MERVCIILDLEGFTVNKIFYVREVGSFNWKGDSTSVKFTMPLPFRELSAKDKRSATYLTQKLHGLPFDSRPKEHAQPQDSVDEHVLRLYRESKTLQLDAVAFKGGHAERDILERLKIPYVDLEEYGCPKVEKLLVHDTLGENIGCGEHRGRVHCSTRECWIFWWWMMDNQDARRAKSPRNCKGATVPRPNMDAFVFTGYLTRV